MKKKKEGRRWGNRSAILCITMVVVLLLVDLAVQSHALREKNAAYAEQEARLEKQLAAEQKRTEEINGLEEYMKTDEYIEKVARDKLGLIYPDEILIKPEN